MARVLCVVILFTLTIIQTIDANANLCKGKHFYEPCGDAGMCMCANENDITVSNPGKNKCKGNLVCKNYDCLAISGRASKPKMRNGAFIMCYVDGECGQNFACSHEGYCCHVATGKRAKLN